MSKEDEALKKAYDEYERAVKGKVSVVLSDSCTKEEKATAVGFFRGFEIEKVTKDNQIKGFSYWAKDFNRIVYNGCKHQPSTACASTQTDWDHLRPSSPSVFKNITSKEQLYKE